VALDSSIQAPLTLPSGTSKHNPSIDTYGHHGRFLSSLSALSLLSVTSRHRAEADECTVSFHEAQVIARFRTTQEHQRVLRKTHGTKVAVRDLFRTLPVRVKHRAIQYQFQENLDKEFEDLKRKIVSLLLAWSRPIRIVMSNPEKRRCLLRLNHESTSYGEGDIKIDEHLPFRLHWICSLLLQAGYIVQASFASWATASARTSTTTIRAAISREPAPTKHVQFISFGTRPVYPVHGSRVIFDEVNRMFALSSFGAAEDDMEISEDRKSGLQTDKQSNKDDYKARRLRGMTKGADRWPMFYIRIDSSSEHRAPDAHQTHDSKGEATLVLHTALQLLRPLIYQFLEEHHFRPRAKRQKRRDATSPGVHMTDSFDDPATHPGSGKTSRQFANLIGSVTGTTAQPGLSKPTQQVVEHGFNSWSRVKSGKRDGFGHIICGLPKSESFQYDSRPVTAPAVSTNGHKPQADTGRRALSDEQLQHPLDDDLQLLLQDLQNEDLINGLDDNAGAKNVRHSIASTSSDRTTEAESVVRCDNAPDDETILWSNTAMGRLVRINPRASLIVPDLQEHRDATQESQEEHHTNLSDEALSVAKRTTDWSVLPTRNATKSDLNVAPESWVGRLLKGSAISILRQLEAPKPWVTPKEAVNLGEGPSCCHGRSATGNLKLASAPFNNTPAVTRLSKRGLDDAQVLAQVDQKFILVKITTSQNCVQNDSPGSQQPLGETFLVLVDQHAADERCQVEALYRALSNVERVQLLKPMCFDVSTQECQLFEAQKAFFADWGFYYETQTTHAHSASQIRSSSPQKRPTKAHTKDDHTVVVTALPELIAERCRLEPKILIDLLRSEVWARAESGSATNKVQVLRQGSEFTPSDLEYSRQDGSQWLNKIATCPKGLIEMLNSRACRSAIMFNDVLSVHECKALIKRLAQCRFPFQCAHGRPSMVVLGGLGEVDADDGRSLRPGAVQEDVEGGVDFAKAFDNWQAKIRKLMDGE
jgi:DNA mismatch repair protein MLH3